MSQDQKNEQELDPMPANDDKFWPKEADNQVHELKVKSCVNTHRYRSSNANTVRCDCGAGYILSPGWEITNEGQLVVH